MWPGGLWVTFFGFPRLDQACHHYHVHPRQGYPCRLPSWVGRHHHALVHARPPIHGQPVPVVITFLAALVGGCLCGVVKLVRHVLGG